MLVAAIWAGGATIVYLLLLWLLRFVGRAVTRRMLQLADSTAGQVRIGGTELLQPRPRDRLRRGSCCGSASGSSSLLLTYEWVGFVLGRFPFTRPWGEQLNAFLRRRRSSIC